MKFLVVLICVSLNYFWKRDIDRFDDTWFFRMRQFLESRTASIARRYSGGWLLGTVLVFLVPLIVLGAVLVLMDDVLLGLFTLIINIIVLLYAFDRTQPGMLAEGFLQHWRSGDLEGGYLYLREHLSRTELPPVDDHRQLHQRFGRLYVYRCLEKMFVMFFWYVLTGPLGVLFTYIAYQLRDGAPQQENSQQEHWIRVLVLALEWIPLRLLGITFCLAGDFESCFARFRNVLLETPQDNDAVIYDLATAALGLEPVPPADSRDFERYQGLATLEIDSLQALLERSQIIWICFLALATIFGLQL
ncbi:MAG: hypothetical protein RLZZ385_904 [Pseudomonadota bacterium]|jgi:AmpE protein